MGYTQYYYYKNPVVDLAQKTNAVAKDREGYTKFPDHDVYVKRIKKHVDAFKKISKELRSVFKHLPEHSSNAGNYHLDAILKLAGGNGKGKPVITPEKIWFNGIKKNDLYHETFALDLFDMGNFKTIDGFREDGVFSFCKTARKPYDFAVCIALMVIKHHLDEDFSVSSDGDIEDWQPSIDFYEEYFKRKAPVELIEYLKEEEQTA